MMYRSGDAFIDTGFDALSVIKEQMGFTNEEAIEYLIDRYLNDWNKATYSFFPNSPFNNPKLKKDRKKTILEVFEQPQKAYRDKVFLTGSKGFSNFYPSGIAPEIGARQIIGTFFCPFACCQFNKSGLYSIMQSHDDAFMKEFIHKNVVANLKLSSPRKIPFTVKEYFHRTFIQKGDMELAAEVYEFSNFAQDPRFRSHYINCATIRLVNPRSRALLIDNDILRFSEGSYLKRLKNVYLEQFGKLA